MPKTKKQRKLRGDAQWCIENSKSLTLKKFVEHHGLLERQYSQTRYRIIIRKYLEEKNKLLSDLESWKKTEDYQLFWLSRKRKKTELAAKNGAAEYICQAVSEEVTTVCGEVNASDNASIGDSSSVISFEEDLETLGDEEGTHCLQNNVDVTRLFVEYKNKARDMSPGDLLKLETNTHELLALTNILLLSPKQSSTLLLDVFSEKSINTIYETLNKIKANTKDLDDNLNIIKKRVCFYFTVTR